MQIKLIVVVACIKYWFGSVCLLPILGLFTDYIYHSNCTYLKVFCREDKEINLLSFVYEF